MLLLLFSKNLIAVVLDTVECIDCIMFRGPTEVQLDLNTVNPRVSAHEAMQLVPGFFESGTVVLNKMKKCRKIWYLEIRKNESIPL
jgi:hypothetical protein